MGTRPIQENLSRITPFPKAHIQPPYHALVRTAGVPQPPNPQPQNRWLQAREYRRKVYQHPYLNAEEDTTIQEVEQHAEFWVNRLVQAMTNTSNVKDRDSSHAKKMFLPGAYDALLVEATCREIFAFLIDRCKNGFRGPEQFNKAIKPAKGSEPDKIAKSVERMSNVIKALMWNKRVCKAMLYENWKIKLLVNHPLAYDKEKDSQKGSNDQRRARQQEEREKLKKTEEELKAYQSGNDQELTAANIQRIFGANLDGYKRCVSSSVFRPSSDVDQRVCANSREFFGAEECDAGDLLYADQYPQKPRNNWRSDEPLKLGNDYGIFQPPYDQADPVTTPPSIRVVDSPSDATGSLSTPNLQTALESHISGREIVRADISGVKRAFSEEDVKNQTLSAKRQRSKIPVMSYETQRNY
ncbi:hypothetical protein K469DRAFT_693475 [Zopfia rhizophila CBS 207.26]|uniref:Uncharacterized protein n=1 Tax=Zopfia rhizophila CBS 207.26 TaxID=1314779 RepID=A0A6A6DPZ1_9PEZI|nr:hypothetical protein K469DRAFT_693475 [Zopfia rhizophila CBS 207.26]